MAEYEYVEQINGFQELWMVARESVDVMMEYKENLWGNGRVLYFGYQLLLNLHMWENDIYLYSIP